MLSSRGQPGRGLHTIVHLHTGDLIYSSATVAAIVAVGGGLMLAQKQLPSKQCTDAYINAVRT
jgi:hypothetical protein